MVEGFTSPVATGLTLTLLHFLWQGLLIGLGYWAILAATGLRSAQARYATLLLALSVMALCPLVTFAVVYDSVVAVSDTPTPAVATTSSDRADAPVDPVIAHRAGAAVGLQATSEIASEFGEPRSDRQGFALVVRALDASQPFVLLLWLAGVILSGARLTAGLLTVIWLRSGRAVVSTALTERSLTLARRLGLTSARIFASTRIREAAVVGFWKPVVLLPASWLTQLPADVLEAVIAHELAHIRRFDVWVNLVQRILETVLFYHPMVWWLSNRIRLEREMCCDELAVYATGDRGEYVIALEQVGRLQVHRTMRLTLSFTGDRKMKLLSRIQNVLGTAKQTDRGPTWLVGITAVAIPLVLVSVGGAFTGQSIAVAQERERGRSAEGEAGPRRSPESDAAPRRSAEADTGRRRSAEGDRGPRRTAEAEGNRDGSNALRGFKPQTQREDALYQMILQLQRDVASMRREIQARRGTRDGEGDKRGLRDDESTKRGPRDGSRESGQRDGEQSSLSPRWQYSKEGKVFKAYDKNGDMVVTLDEWLMMFNGNTNSARRETVTNRFNEAEPSGDGKLTPAEFVYWYTKGRFENVREGGGRGLRDGESGQRGARDPERGQRGPRDGEGPAKQGPRDGEGPANKGPRDG